MGLDFSHGEASWSYSGFDRFRVKLAQEIGMNFDEMDGLVPNGRSWDDFDDPVLPLLNHSDCDGDLTVKECKQVAPRLRELVKDWPDHNYDKHTAIRLAESMELATLRNEALKFQ